MSDAQRLATSPAADPRDRLADAIPKLRAFAVSLTRDVTSADDLVQDTILKAWSNMDTFDPSTNLDEKPDHDSRWAFKDFQLAFDLLSPEHREVLILIGASGFSCEEAAEMTGVAVGTVKSRSSRARRRLAELLHLEDGEDMFSGTDGSAQAAVLRSAVAAC
jgi:RNA polymerase sigma-70 factor, ECF subfamily